MTRFPIRLAFATLATFGVALAALAAATSHAPEPTDKGQFVGTWYRVEPGVRQGLQLRRAADGKGWALRFYWQTRENFLIDTEWATRKEFAYRGFPGYFEIVPDEAASTDKRLVFHYHREQSGADSASLVEDGDLVVFRTNNGRNLVWSQEKLSKHVKLAHPTAPYEEDGENSTGSRTWVFVHASKRFLQWDEVPW